MAVPFRVKATFEYTSPHDDDLNFPVGQIITVTHEEDDDWYEGEYLDDDGVRKQGIFPRNFVEKYEPMAPPRPARTRTKKESEAAQPSPEAVAGASASTAAPARDEPLPLRPEEPETEQAEQPLQKRSLEEQVSPTAITPTPSKPVSSAPAPASPPRASNVAAAKAPAVSNTAPAPKPKPAAPPPVSEKPAGNSFKDRIAAFNKPAAPPVAPFKPGGLGGSGGSANFVKKPFVAPPPSRNAYVPPPRETPTVSSYKREEDPEIKEREAANQEQAEKAGLVPHEPSQDGGQADQPKPTSLKERIALLQQQQMEQSQRHAEAAAKKDKPKKPPKKRTESAGQADAIPEEIEGHAPGPSMERKDTEELGTRTSTDEVHPARAPPPPRRKSSKGPTSELVHDGNDADMSGAGDTTEGQDDTTERDDSDETPKRLARLQSLSTSSAAAPGQVEVEEEAGEQEEEEEEEEEVDPEIRRKEELRARMAKMSGGMGFHGMFGGPMPPTAMPPPKKKAAKAESSAGADETSPISRAAPPIPTPMALPGMGSSRPSAETKRDEEEDVALPSRAAPPPVPSRAPEGDGRGHQDEGDATTPLAVLTEFPSPRRDVSGPIPLPRGRPLPPPVPSDSRPPPPPPPADLKSASDGSVSDDELSGGARGADIPSANAVARSPPMPPQPLQSPGLPSRSPPLSPRLEETSPVSPSTTSQRRFSRPPPPIPGSAPIAPPSHNRPPPPPPPGEMLRDPHPEAPQALLPTRPPQAGEEEDEENTEYEGDYDTDIASSVPHKDALKTHVRESSLEDNGPQSPKIDAPPTLPPPVPTSGAPRAIPPPVPAQPPPDSSSRRSMDAPRAAPPLPPPAVPSPRIAEDYQSHGHSTTASGAFASSHGPKTLKNEDEGQYSGASPTKSPTERRAPPTTPGGRGTQRQSMEIPRTSISGRRSTDLLRPSLESGYIANDIDLAVQSGWWKQANQLPPALQGRRDIYFECDETTSTNQGSKTVITREIFVLFQDYSQTILTVRYDPYDHSDVELEQRHEAPPRALRQDQMEQFHDMFGRRIAEAAWSKKDTIVGDGTPQGLIAELLRPFKNALLPVGTRAYGALVYSNMANASTQQHDVIRPGDIISIRNAKFQGKHGPMHAKYSAEVGKPDHVGIVAEWDGTKKKVRAWEQGRESKKVKMESFKLDDLRSGEVKIWRVVPRSWIGWNGQG
ncbi:hypothetical protein HIM_07562 [Hirsutella minnesotensis 3608]|uniref:SH3 domain-containing protein n=1 Tax=Hirsutella minnesotensis 3608 TaxID=1043627 RepID=A0A0F7ZN21_9HYPO|nr:hypothetical protein HIM_07562 [Hirsutella minnesotensis 3608]